MQRTDVRPVFHIAKGNNEMAIIPANTHFVDDELGDRFMIIVDPVGDIDLIGSPKLDDPVFLWIKKEEIAGVIRLLQSAYEHLVKEE